MQRKLATANSILGRVVGRAWWYLRQITGDAAYENYLHRAPHRNAGCRPLTREEFYLDTVRRRYTGVSRCC